MIVRSLEGVEFKLIMNCFLVSFKNYFVDMPTDVEYYKERWNNVKVRFDLSYGMFDNQVLVGFIINGIDKRNEEVVAFNTGTGVIPEYRGKKIIKSIYKFALKDLKRNGVTKCSLEVIKENIIAIKAYESIGFKKCKNYKCFKGKINVNVEKKVTLLELDLKKLNWRQLPNQEFYSWDNHKNSLISGSYKCFQVINEKTPMAYFVIDLTNGYIAQFDVLNKDKFSWDYLFLGIKKISETVKINNVDERLISKLNYLKTIELINTVDQYEMELSIK
ncbi:GNAT family N-acetyltransferase [Aquimarina sediminis]|uniref:GNAT family N-acetyltransferase n=1 Tax=Aquimarina sediminis TaxID=2070536 RepID=UPI000CA01C1E|nr:GNAT family N-acetyltransferase [Aquimarina sediminis]